MKIDKEGYLVKKSLKDYAVAKGIAAALKRDKDKAPELYTTKKKRYFILCDSFLYYFKSKEVTIKTYHGRYPKIFTGKTTTRN